MEKRRVGNHYRGREPWSFGLPKLRLVAFLAGVIPSIFLFSLQATAQNYLGMNLNGVSYFTPEQPFLNIFKTASQWGTSNAGDLSSLNLDSNGWPRAIPGTSNYINTLVLSNLPSASYPAGYSAGNYVVLYDGQGTMLYDFDASLVSSGVGRDIIRVAAPSGSGIRIRITSTDPAKTGNYIRNIRLVYSPDSTASNVGSREALLNSGEMFNPDFIKMIKPFKRFRFVEWMHVNQNPVSHQSAWSGRPVPTEAFYGADDGVSYLNGPLPAGVPVEVMVALCNEVGADAWFNMPTLADDNYVSQFATVVHGLLVSPLKAYVEFSNEVWAFNANTAALSAPGYVHFPSAPNNYAASIDEFVYRTVKMSAAWKTAFGSESGRVVVVLGGQAAGGNPNAINQYELDLLATADGGSSSYWAGAASSHVDALGIAPYFGYDVGNASFTLDQLFTEVFSGGLVSGGPPGGMIAQAISWVATNKALVGARSLKLVGYEGGQSLANLGNSTLGALYIAANRDPRMEAAYTTYLNGIVNAGLTDWNCLSDVSQFSQFGSWGALENVLQTSSPKYAALKAFAASHVLGPVTATSGAAAGTGAAGATSTSIGTTTSGGTITSNRTPASGGTATPAGPGAAGATSTSIGTTTSGGTITSNRTPASGGTATPAGRISGNNATSSRTTPSGTTTVAAVPPPVVAIHSPANGATIRNDGHINITSSATDPAGIASITITADSKIILTCSNTTSCSAELESRSLTRGTHMIAATAISKNGLQGRASVTIVDLGGEARRSP
jgi:hypothetical protein